MFKLHVTVRYFEHRSISETCEVGFGGLDRALVNFEG